jgi:agmatinase
VTHYRPADASVQPRYSGVRTFARLPLVELPADGVDVAVLGAPFDTATS